MAKELEKYGLGSYYTELGREIFPADANGIPFTDAALQSKGDPVADFTEDLAAEQKARAAYEHLFYLADNPDVIDPLRFLR